MAFYIFLENTFMAYLMCLEENGLICFTQTLIQETVLFTSNKQVLYLNDIYMSIKAIVV